jgi:hypothetical protein
MNQLVHYLLFSCRSRRNPTSTGDCNTSSFRGLSLSHPSCMNTQSSTVYICKIADVKRGLTLGPSTLSSPVWPFPYLPRHQSNFFTAGYRTVITSLTSSYSYTVGLNLFERYTLFPGLAIIVAVAEPVSVTGHWIQLRPLGIWCY